MTKTNSDITDAMAAVIAEVYRRFVDQINDGTAGAPPDTAPTKDFFDHAIKHGFALATDHVMATPATGATSDAESNEVRDMLCWAAAAGVASLLMVDLFSNSLDQPEIEMAVVN